MKCKQNKSISEVFFRLPMLRENKFEPTNNKRHEKDKEKRIRFTEQQTNDKELNRANSVYEINT